MDAHASSGSGLTRRDILKGGAAGLAAAGLPGRAWAQAPKRGGTLSLRLWEPPHWDPYLTISYKTHIAYSFTHSRLLRHKAGPGVAPGTFPIEGDLAESWTQPNETTYVFKLRQGVRWQNKPPLNGRELVAEDVKYSFERFLGEKGNANKPMLASVDKVEAPDKYTVRVTLKEPFAWFLDMLSNPGALWIIARECVEKSGGDLRKVESAVGTGPYTPGKLQAERGLHPREEPGLLRPGPALHRPDRRDRRRGQRLPHGGLPRRASMTWGGSSPARSTASTGCRSRTSSGRSGPGCRWQSSPPM